MATYRFIVATLLLLLPVVALAAAPRTFQELAFDLVDLLDAATAVLIVAGLVVYFYGISTNIMKFSEEGGEKLRAYFLWGIIVLFVMVSIWGIVRLLQDTLFGGSQFGGASSGNQVPQDAFRSSDLGGMRLE